MYKKQTDRRTLLYRLQGPVSEMNVILKSRFIKSHLNPYFILIFKFINIFSKIRFIIKHTNLLKITRWTDRRISLYTLNTSFGEDINS